MNFLYLLLAAQIVSPPYPTAGWDQAAPTLTDAQGYVYRYYLDGMATGAAFAGVICAGAASPFQCNAKLPVTVSGQHTISVTAELITGERSPASEPVTFELIPPAAPGQPYTVVIIK